MMPTRLQPSASDLATKRKKALQLAYAHCMSPGIYSLESIGAYAVAQHRMGEVTGFFLAEKSYAENYFKKLKCGEYATFLLGPKGYTMDQWGRNCGRIKDAIWTWRKRKSRCTGTAPWIWSERAVRDREERRMLRQWNLSEPSMATRTQSTEFLKRFEDFWRSTSRLARVSCHQAHQDAPTKSAPLRMQDWTCNFSTLY